MNIDKLWPSLPIHYLTHLQNILTFESNRINYYCNRKHIETHSKLSIGAAVNYSMADGALVACRLVFFM